MYLTDIGWVRPLLIAVLGILGALLRFWEPSRPFGRTGLFRARTEKEIRRLSTHRIGELLLLWAFWILVQIVVGMPESWMNMVWAPLVIVVGIALSYPARLYTRRLLGPGPEALGDRPFPPRGGWIVVLVRETIPLAALLASILVVRSVYPRIPEEIPVAWNLAAGGFKWMARDEGLRILRHQTMLVYLLLAGLEGVYLIWRWTRGRGVDIARRMLTRRHWLYFHCKVGWVFLFAGINLGFVFHAAEGNSLIPYLLPGFLTLAALAVLISLQVKRGRYSPPTAP